MKYSLLFLVFTFSLFSGEVYIETETAEISPTVSERLEAARARPKPCIKRDRIRLNPCYSSSRIYLGGKVAHLSLHIKKHTNTSFKEADQNTHLNGILGGADIAYEYKKPFALYTGIYGSFLTGKVTHSGVPKRTIYDVEAEGRFGYHYQGLQGYRMEVSPYIGFGFNYFYQRRNNTDQSPSILYEYYKYYLPVGFLFNYRVFRWFYFGFHFKWFPDIDPTLHIGFIKRGRWILVKENNQLLAQVPLTFRFGCKRQWDISFVPYWERKKDGGTDAIAPTGVELGIPKQTLIYWGGNVNIGYSF